MSEASLKVNLSKGPTAPEAPGRAGGNIVTQWPLEENAILAKLICDPTYADGRRVFRPATYFTHPTGNKPTDKARHICRTFFGEKSSPENDKYWETVKALSALKKANQVDTSEYKVLKETLKTFKRSSRGYVTFVRPDSPTIQALRIPESIIDELIGCKGNDYKEAKTSLVDKMVSAGASPFDLTCSEGWLKFWKKGEGVNTEYFVAVAEVDAEAETKDGKKVKYKEAYVGKVHERFMQDIDLSEIPDVINFEKRLAWTVEESQAFVNSQGTLDGVPVRARKSASSQASEETADASTEAPVTGGEYAKVNEEEIPY